jgi:metacaspase-1
MWLTKLRELWKRLVEVFSLKEDDEEQPSAGQRPTGNQPESGRVSVSVNKEAPMTKKALVVGIDKYKNPAWNLEGCTLDAAIMSGMMQDHYGFPGDNVRVLMDDRATKGKIEGRLDWLVRDAKPGDVLVFFYAGHGSQVRDRDGDELEDRMDEILCPHDLDWDDPLTDDILNSYFKRVPQGANLTVVFDCCNSGTATRSLLAPVTPEGEIIGKIEYQKTRYIKPPLDIEHRSRGIVLKTRRIGEAITRENHVLMSACMSNQEAQEKRFGGETRGAFSYYLVAALKRADWKMTCRQAHQDTLTRLRDNGFAQIPQLEGPDEFLERQIFA